MMKKTIIAFGHQKSVGKDEIIKFCIDILRPKTRALRILRRGFADKIYDLCHSLYGWAGFKTREYYARNTAAKNDVLDNGYTVRALLIALGQHIRKFDDSVWVNANLRSDDFDVLFLSDLRFPTEFKAVKDLGGTLIRITRPGLDTPTDEADTALNGWEKAWDDHVENDQCLNKLYKEAERVINRYVLV